MLGRSGEKKAIPLSNTSKSKEALQKEIGQGEAFPLTDNYI